MKLAESIRDLSDRFDLSVFYPADQADDPLLGDDQTGKVYPFAATFCPGRGQALADLFVVVKCQVSSLLMIEFPRNLLIAME